MKAYLWVSLVVIVPLAGCGAGSLVDPDLVDQTSFTAVVDHPYFPITPGTVRVYDGHHEGLPRREEVRTLDTTRTISGVECTAVKQEVFVDGVLTEVTTEWYAQDLAGNVWKFGEEGRELDEGEFIRSEDSWIADLDDVPPWQAFPGDPQVGEQYVGFRPNGQDAFYVASVTESAAVPAGNFNDCLQISENPEDPDDNDIILYARGVGRVSEQNHAGRIELTSVSAE